MKAVCWHGKHDLRVDTVPDPKIEQPDDCIIQVTSTAICGSDLHLYDNYMPLMKAGDIIGHEPMGVVVEVGANVKKLKKGDRVVVPFNISCGNCWWCEKTLYSLCDESNPPGNRKVAEEMMGQSPAGLFGYSHLVGGYPGGQAEYLRVPYADVGPLKIESDLPDEKVLFLSDIFPTGYMAAENAQIQPGDTVAVFGCGPVAQFCIKSAWMLGAGRVIAIDCVPERLEMARTQGKAETIDFMKETPYERLKEMTRGRMPDSCIDAVGCEAHSAGSFDSVMDAAKAKIGLATDRAHALRTAIMCCRKGGTLSVPGVYVGFPDKIPFGALMNKGLTVKTGQTHTQRYMPRLLKEIESGTIDPSFVITHKLPLADAPGAYKIFQEKKDGCIKVVLKP
jgi:threonine dehydrogenase-like Zn-dependent dehydrogenase